MEKRTLLAITLAILVMLVYSRAIQKYYPAPQETPLSPESKQTVSFPAKPAQETVSFPNIKPNFTTLRQFTFNHVDYELSDVSGCIKSINLNKFNRLEKKIPEQIYEATASRDAIFSISAFPSAGDISGATYSYSETNKGLEYTLGLNNGLQIKKIYWPDNNYGLWLELKITNNSTAAVKGAYSMVAVSDIKALTQDDARFLEAMVSLAGKQKRISIRSIAGQPATYYGSIDWAAMQNRYFCLAVKPFQPVISATANQAAVKSSNANIFIELQTDIDIEPQATVIHKFLLYSGPSDPQIMALHQAGIENAANLGTFADISRLLLMALKFFYNVSHNYGLAIIILAVLISIILYPLTLKSFKSMKQMQLVQPKVDRLRKEYKDNPQKLNKEMLELYKKHKVNPFGGCLPMLLQMPIFIALYQALMRAIELKNAKFLWIKDLSGPDRAFLLPRTGIPVNILPILMAITMFFQQKLSTPSHASQDKEDTLYQQQKTMAIMMPVLFGVIFYNMPSALVLYWFTNTLIMFFQQARIMRNFHVEKEAVT
jgi:YidC/Oxa1 family membrane protein insertase